MPKTYVTAPDGIDPERRLMLKSLAAAGLAGFGLAGGVAWPARAADAPDWPHDAFKQKNEPDVLKALYGDGKSAEPSDKIALDVPEIAENGAVVPVSIKSSLTGVTSIAILIAFNPYTLAAYYRLPAGTEPVIACRLKMARTSKVTVVAESDGRLYSAAKEVKVTLGGCGG